MDQHKLQHSTDSGQVRDLILSKLTFHEQLGKRSTRRCVSHAHTHEHTGARTTHCEDLSLICIWSLYPTLPQLSPVYYNSIFPLFQSKDLFLLIFNNVQARQACPWGDYLIVFGVSSWLHQRNLIWFGRNPPVPGLDLFRPPRCAGFLLCQRGWSWWIWSERGRERGIRWKDYNFQWREIIRNNKS